MARPTKKGLDYFSHDCNLDVNLEYIEAVHGLQGYAIFFKLLERIYGDKGYYLDWNKKVKAIFSKSINMQINEVETIVSDMLTEGLFSQKMYEKFKILTSKGVQKRYLEAAKKRVGKLIEERHNLVIDVSDAETIVSAEETQVSDAESTQSKVKESKVKESKEEKDVSDAETKEEEIDKYENWKRDFLNDRLALDANCMTHKIPESEIPKLLDRFILMKKGFNEDNHKDYQDFKKNFFHWVPKQKSNDGKNTAIRKGHNVSQDREQAVSAVLAANSAINTS